MIGDPSGRSATLPVLSADEIDAHARTFQEQAFKVLDPDRTEVRYNGEWLSKLTYAGQKKITRLPQRSAVVALIWIESTFSLQFWAQT